MADHAKFSPSKMQRIIACPGSVALESTLPDSRNDYADEGTVAHHIAALCLLSGRNVSELIGKSFTVDAKGVVSECP